MGFGMVLACFIQKRPGLKARLAAIEGLTFLLDVTDIQKRYPFHVQKGKLCIVWGEGKKPDVTLRGDFESLWGLLRRRADADSLFFSRKLVVEGDVQASIFLKNILENL
jgi:predicted lipid carrier protein YhbT